MEADLLLDSNGKDDNGLVLADPPRWLGIHGPPDTDKMHLPAREMDSLLHGSDPSPLPP
jgi:hypothetical protein